MKQTSGRRKPEKAILLLLAVMAIGMFALPSTLAMYSGQHEFVDGDSVNCGRCHESTDTVYGELTTGNAHTAFTCKDCHGFSNTTLTTSNTDDGTGGHAATVAISCVDCHAELAAYNTAILDPDGITVENELQVPNAAHTAMHTTYSAIGQDLDDLCIACHTKVAMSSNMAYSTSEPFLPLDTWSYSWQ